ncbi:hypothetical protein K1719_036262 [Acacia pycnantha]|nr:hypothetical protein K1719_036262 [Acacia pycnantha]
MVKTIAEAIKMAPEHSSRRFIIYLRAEGSGEENPPKLSQQFPGKIKPMGEEEEKPEEVKMEEKKPEEPNKEEDGKKAAKEEANDIVLKVYMHCEGCAHKVRRSLKGFPVFPPSPAIIIIESLKTDCELIFLNVYINYEEPEKQASSARLTGNGSQKVANLFSGHAFEAQNL